MRDEDVGPDRVAAWSSTDGQTWLPASVRRPAARGLSAGVTHVADGPAGAIALASFFGQDMPRSRLYRTVDGLAWEPIPMPQRRDVVWSALRSIPGGYLLIGNTTRGRPATFRSDDGDTWERVREAPWILDAAAAPDGTIVAIADHEVLTTSDLVTWVQVMEAPGVEPDADTPTLNMIVWDGTRFATAGITFEGCPEGVDECYQTWLSTSPDGSRWTESAGPDGQPGPDDATQFAAMTTLRDTSVLLGFAGASPKTAWVVPR
jgi:hypothetical protein